MSSEKKILEMNLPSQKTVTDLQLPLAPHLKKCLFFFSSQQHPFHSVFIISIVFLSNAWLSFVTLFNPHLSIFNERILKSVKKGKRHVFVF